ncbi:hypothetical protein KCU88_g5052, partial [Aureobasidium melanogenum]
MAIYNAECSALLNATVSEWCPAIHVLPLNESDVYDFLDAHPDVLVKYLKERAGLAESLVKPLLPGLVKTTPAQDAAGGRGVAAPSAVADDSVEEEVPGFVFAGELFLDESEAAEESSSPELIRETIEISDDEPEEVDNGKGGAKKRPPPLSMPTSQQWPPRSPVRPSWSPITPPPASPSPASPTPSSSSSESSSKPSSKSAEEPESEREQSEDEKSSSSEESSASSSKSAKEPESEPEPTEAEKSSSPEESSSSSEDDSDDDLLPFPAPPNLVAASREEKPGRKWRLFEQESCIQHMVNIRAEGKLQGEARFREAQRRMAQQDGVVKTGKTAVKNFWNRYGRARSLFDERKNRKAPLSTSKQGKAARAKAARRKAAAKKTQQAARKRANGTKKAASTLSQKAKGKRKRTYETDSESESEEQEEEDFDSPFFAPSDESGPDETPPRKRKRDDDDDDDEWQPDAELVNAVQKGLRTRRARVAY